MEGPRGVYLSPCKDQNMAILIEICNNVDVLKIYGGFSRETSKGKLF